jgi:hypothetical protein
LIRTTGEHPFYVVGKGWTDACLLQPGDLLCPRDGRAVPVQECCDTGEYETVYNCRVAEYHTYFVGDATWPFSVWAHNRCDITEDISKIGQPGKQGHVRVVKSEEELLDIFNKYAQGGVEQPLTAEHIARKIQWMVDLTDTSRGPVRLIYRKVSESGGPAIDIMIKNLKGGFKPWRKIHIG